MQSSSSPILIEEHHLQALLPWENTHPQLVSLKSLSPVVWEKSMLQPGLILYVQIGFKIFASLFKTNLEVYFLALNTMWLLVKIIWIM